jgi:hypothetical protein
LEHIEAHFTGAANLSVRAFAPNMRSFKGRPNATKPPSLTALVHRQIFPGNCASQIRRSYIGKHWQGWRFRTAGHTCVTVRGEESTEWLMRRSRPISSASEYCAKVAPAENCYLSAHWRQRAQSLVSLTSLGARMARDHIDPVIRYLQVARMPSPTIEKGNSMTRRRERKLM